MEAKLSQLKNATKEAESQMLKAKELFDDAEQRLTAAKDLLKQMDAEDQKKIQVNDTKLPEILDLYSIAKESYDESKARYESNMKYVKIIEEKLGL